MQSAVIIEKRNNRRTIRLTDKEIGILENNSKILGLSISETLRRIINIMDLSIKKA